MVRCEICGAVLEERPVRQVSNLQPDGFWEDGFLTRCPYCESPHFSDYDPYGKEAAQHDGGPGIDL